MYSIRANRGWTKIWTPLCSESSCVMMYSQDKIDSALQVYHQCGSVINTVRMLCYPTRKALYIWIKNEDTQKPPQKALDNINTDAHPRNPPVEVKMDAIHRCFEFGEGIKYVSEEIGHSQASIYAWRKRYLRGGATALMNDKNIKLGTLKEGTQDSLNAETQMLLARLDNMQMEAVIIIRKPPTKGRTSIAKSGEKFQPFSTKTAVVTGTAGYTPCLAAR